MKKKWYVRGLRTFLQAFVSSIAITFSAYSVTDLDSLKSVAMSGLISALAGGISAVMNWADEKREKGE